VEVRGGQPGGFPFLAERVDDARADEALDIGAGCVFRAEFVALAGVEGAGEQGAEDGGLDIGPIGGRGSGKHGDLRGGEREGAGVLKEAAAEVGDLLEEERGVVGAGGHFPPERTDEDGEALRGGFHTVEELLEAAFGKEADILGEHGEEAALQEAGDGLRRVAVGFEGFPELGEAGGDVAGDLGGDLRGVERMGIGEDEAQSLEDLRTVEVGEENAVVFWIGEPLVASTGASELGVEVDGVADIAHDEKWRPAVASREMRDVVASLMIGTLEGFVERGAATAAVAGFRRRGQIDFADALLDLQDKVRGLVEIDVVCNRGAIGRDAGDRAVEDLEVFLGIRRGGVRARNAEEVAEFGEERLIIRPLSSARIGPAGNEGIDRRHKWWKMRRKDSQSERKRKCQMS
jgi:hypothetical protein